MIHSLEIKEFRLFKDMKFLLGKYLTVIAGRNATGKSTVLGMLANSCELKKKDGVPILQPQFRAQFSEIFKGSPEFDRTGSNRYKVNFSRFDDCETIVDYRDFRVSWQNEQTRFRIIPSRNYGGKKTSAKKNWPVLYLGLSRLFPIGESDSEKLNAKELSLTESEMKWFEENYRRILLLRDELNEVRDVRIGETERKAGIGVVTSSYDYLANSAGQDNVGQILCAILSFKRLKDTMGDNYSGGLILIDEIDATLHPASQRWLVDVLIREARQLQLQIVCTTHSLSFLKYICEKTRYNQRNELVGNNIELFYLTNANRRLILLRNPAFTLIENDLKVESIVQNNSKIKVYTEDDEARWLLKKLVSKFLFRLEILDVSVGAQALLKLCATDPNYFGSVIVVLDGDISDDEISRLAPNNHRLGNLVKLPGGKRPEQLIYDYLLGLEFEHPFWQKGIGIGLTLDYFESSGPNSNCYSGSERERYKTWFNAHLAEFESIGLFDYWAQDHMDSVNEFIQEFTRAFNCVADRLLIERIEEEMTYATV